MKKVSTLLVAAALSGSVLTVSASAAPLTTTACQGSTAPTLSQCQNFSCELSLRDILTNCLDRFLSSCPDTSLPGQTPELPGGDVVAPEQTPELPDGDVVAPEQTPELPDGENTPSDGENTSPDGEYALSNYETEVVGLVNEARVDNGLQPLTASGELSRVAHIKSQNMVDENYFSHTSPTYGTPFEMLTSFGISYRAAGENIAYGQRTPEEVVTGWMNSPGHRANILNASYTQIGVGYVADGNYWTQLFIG